MKRRIWTVAAALACVAALVAVPAAYAAYTTAKLEVRQAGTSAHRQGDARPERRSHGERADLRPHRHHVDDHAGAGHDARPRPRDRQGARPRRGGPAARGQPDRRGTRADRTRDPGCLPRHRHASRVLGDGVERGGADPARFPRIWLRRRERRQRSVPRSSRCACRRRTFRRERPVGRRSGRSSTAPSSPSTGSSARLRARGSRSGRPIDRGSARSTRPQRWLRPPRSRPGAVSVAARRSGARGVGAVVAGRVTQGGQARAGATVSIFGGPRSNRLKRLGTVRTSANGAFTFRARTGVFFRANVAAAAGASPALCTAIGAAIAPIPCVNPTTNGFTAVSRVIRKR